MLPTRTDADSVRMLGNNTVTWKKRCTKQWREGQSHQQMVNPQPAGYRISERLISQGAETSTPLKSMQLD